MSHLIMNLLASAYEKVGIKVDPPPPGPIRIQSVPEARPVEFSSFCFDEVSPHEVAVITNRTNKSISLCGFSI
jgi:hypothetical protein